MIFTDNKISLDYLSDSIKKRNESLSNEKGIINLGDIEEYGIDKDKNLISMICNLKDWRLYYDYNTTQRGSMINQNLYVHGDDHYTELEFRAEKEKLEILIILTQKIVRKKVRAKLALDCLENVIIPKLNEQRKKYIKEINETNKILAPKIIHEIYGIMRPFDGITIEEARAFYENCGYKFRDSSNYFTKSLL